MSRPKTFCWVCGAPSHARQLCAKHNARRYRNGSPFTLKIRAPATCVFVGCERPAYAHDLCRAHVQQRARSGELKPIAPSFPPWTDEEKMRLWSLISHDPEGYAKPKGCVADLAGVLGREPYAARNMLSKMRSKWRERTNGRSSTEDQVLDGY